MPRLRNQPDKVKISVTIMKSTADAFDVIASKHGPTRAEIASEILNAARDIKPDRWYIALAALQRASRGDP